MGGKLTSVNNVHRFKPWQNHEFTMHTGKPIDWYYVLRLSYISSNYQLQKTVVLVPVTVVSSLCAVYHTSLDL